MYKGSIYELILHMPNQSVYAVYLFVQYVVFNKTCAKTNKRNLENKTNKACFIYL